MSRSPPTTVNTEAQGEGTGLLQVEETTADFPYEEQSLALAPEDNNLEEWHGQLLRLQGISSLVAHALALLGTILVSWWVHLLGGLSWSAGQSKQVFNWHPLLMMLAFNFMTVAALSFRSSLYQNYTRNTRKLIHGSGWAVAGTFAAVALIAVFKSHNDAKSGFIANLYSLHSWMGIGVVGIYVVQFFGGFFSFGWNYFGFSPSIKAKMLTIHHFFGPLLYVLVTATILLGIQEKEGFIKCAYTVDQADLFPLSHLLEIPPVCLVSHGMGIVVLAMAVFTSFALHNFRG